MTWAQINALPLCAFTPDMQNRRILDRLLRPSSAEARPYMVEADSTLSLLAHVRGGTMHTVVSDQVASMLVGNGAFRTIPIIDGDATFLIGLVVPDRQPLSPTLRALIDVVMQLRPPAD
jgi:DNA-binding transcriptional LysR family regulator